MRMSSKFVGLSVRQSNYFSAVAYLGSLRYFTGSRGTNPSDIPSTFIPSRLCAMHMEVQVPRWQVAIERPLCVERF